MALHRGVSINRLIHDFKEVLRNPIKNVSASPLEDDLFVWHGNVCSDDGIFSGAPLHFELYFPDNYPQEAPECRLFQAVPHRFVRPAPLDYAHVSNGKRRPISTQARWRVAMWDCIPKHNSWSSCYTVLAVLAQLQVFLLDEELLCESQGASVADAGEAAQQLRCTACCHSGEAPYPPLPTEGHLAVAKRAGEKTLVQKPFVPARSRQTAHLLQVHQSQQVSPAPSRITTPAPSPPTSRPGSVCGEETSYQQHQLGSGGVCGALQRGQQLLTHTLQGIQEHKHQQRQGQQQGQQRQRQQQQGQQSGHHSRHHGQGVPARNQAQQQQHNRQNSQVGKQQQGGDHRRQQQQQGQGGCPPVKPSSKTQQQQQLPPKGPVGRQETTNAWGRPLSLVPQQQQQQQQQRHDQARGPVPPQQQQQQFLGKASQEADCWVDVKPRRQSGAPPGSQQQPSVVPQEGRPGWATAVEQLKQQPQLVESSKCGILRSSPAHQLANGKGAVLVAGGRGAVPQHNPDAASGADRGAAGLGLKPGPASSPPAASAAPAVPRGPAARGFILAEGAHGGQEGWTTAAASAKPGEVCQPGMVQELRKEQQQQVQTGPQKQQQQQQAQAKGCQSSHLAAKNGTAACRDAAINLDASDVLQGLCYQQQQQEAEGAGGVWEQDKRHVRRRSTGGPQELAAYLSALAAKPQRDIIQAVLQEQRELLEASSSSCSSSSSGGGGKGLVARAVGKVAGCSPSTSLPLSVSAAAAGQGMRSQRAAAMAAAALLGQEYYESSPSCLLAQLPTEVLGIILVLLSKSDIASLSVTCRALKRCCDDGALWQELLSSHYPAHRLTASQVCDHKYAYILEAHSLLDGLRCWFSHLSFEQDVLGLPVKIDVKPYSKKVQYLTVFPELVSMSAFKAGLRTTASGEEFDEVLPLYLTADHFNRALPHMKELISKLAPDKVGSDGSPPPPQTWLEVLACVLNTQAVQLADVGFLVSQSTLQVYCQVHRLLLAVCEHWCLWQVVRERLDDFLQHPGRRVKSCTPDLGHLVPLLSLSPRHHWRVMVGPLLSEAMDRGVLWMCKREPALIKRFKQGKADAPDLELVRGAWSSHRVAARIWMYHVVFLELVACPPGSTLELVMDASDAFFGCPGSALGGRFRRMVEDILQVDSWQAFFQRVDLKPQPDATMHTMLLGAWARSLAKKYHTKRTSFAKVHQSGVASTLLRGQTYTCPPNAKEVELEVHFAWKPDGPLCYLDGACLIFGQGREYREMVCWSHQVSHTTQVMGAVYHSGHTFKWEEHQGENTVSINLSRLGPEVQELLLTLSSYEEAMLSHIVQPFLSLRETHTKMKLCQWQLDSISMEERQLRQCVILSRIYRKNAGWAVQTVLQFCDGHTGSPGPMVKAAVNL